MKVGIVFSGGLAKGAFQFGFAKKMLEYIDYNDIKYVSGSSIGFMNASALSLNKMDELEHMWKTIHFANIFKAIKAMCFEDFLNKFFNSILGYEKKFNIPVYSPLATLPFFTYKYYKFSGHYIDKEKKINKFATTTLNFPLFTGLPGFFDGRLSTDGGYRDNIPLKPLIEQHSDELDVIFVLHFDPHYRPSIKWKDKKTKIIDISLGSELYNISFDFDTRTINSLLEKGEAYGALFFDRLLVDGYDAQSMYDNFLKMEEQKYLNRARLKSIHRIVSVLNIVFNTICKDKLRIKEIEIKDNYANESLFDYLKYYCEDSFEVRPFCKEDALVLCNLTYFNYEALLPDYDSEINLQEILDKYHTIKNNYLYAKSNHRIIQKMLLTKRFANLKMTFCKKKSNIKNAVDFLGITYILDEKNEFVSFRGTNLSLSGWIEDISLAIEDITNGHIECANYLNEICNNTDKNIYVGGHSKGGNMAIYAGIDALKNSDKIVMIYNFDGPGFKKDIITLENAGYVEGKICKLIPKDSIVGKLLESSEKYQVYESRTIGLLQHNLIFWKFNKGRLEEAQKVSKHSNASDIAISEFINNLTQEDRKRIMDSVQQVLENNKFNSAVDFIRYPVRFAKSISTLAKIYDKKINKMIITSAKRYFQIYKTL
ncbi:MAG: Mbeg1-like protein [Clostridia bacterium]